MDDQGKVDQSGPRSWFDVIPDLGAPQITDAQLDAATLAYVGGRYEKPEEWRKRFPAAWLETRVRIHAALIAAAAVS